MNLEKTQVIRDGLECSEHFPTRKEARAMFRRLLLALDKRCSYRGVGVVTSIYFTECY